MREITAESPNLNTGGTEEPETQLAFEEYKHELRGSDNESANQN